MAFYKKRIKAHILRRKGYSIIRIAKILGISKSTTSLWCRDIVLTRKQKDRLRQNTINAGHKGRMIGAQVNKDKRELAIQVSKTWAQKTLGWISQREIIIAATALYWSEGSKSQRTAGFLFVNSDPAMILFILRFLKNLGVKKADLSCTVQINEIHRPRIKKVLKFWQKLLDLPEAQLGKPYFVKTKINKVYQNYESYFGICRLRVRRSSLLKYKMLGLIESLKSNNVMPV